MTVYKKYNGLDYRPKFSSSEKGRSREVHHVLDNIFRTRGGGSKKNTFSIDDINEVFVIVRETPIDSVSATTFGLCFWSQNTRQGISEHQDMPPG